MMTDGFVTYRGGLGEPYLYPAIATITISADIPLGAFAASDLPEHITVFLGQLPYYPRVHTLWDYRNGYHADRVQYPLLRSLRVHDVGDVGIYRGLAKLYITGPVLTIGQLETLSAGNPGLETLSARIDEGDTSMDIFPTLANITIVGVRVIPKWVRRHRSLRKLTARVLCPYNYDLTSMTSLEFVNIEYSDEAKMGFSGCPMIGVADGVEVKSNVKLRGMPGKGGCIERLSETYLRVEHVTRHTRSAVAVLPGSIKANDVPYYNNIVSLHINQLCAGDKTKWLTRLARLESLSVGCCDSDADWYNFRSLSSLRWIDISRGWGYLTPEYCAHLAVTLTDLSIGSTRYVHMLSSLTSLSLTIGDESIDPAIYGLPLLAKLAIRARTDYADCCIMLPPGFSTAYPLLHDLSLSRVAITQDMCRLDRPLLRRWYTTMCDNHMLPAAMSRFRHVVEINKSQPKTVCVCPRSLVGIVIRDTRQDLEHTDYFACARDAVSACTTPPVSMFSMLSDGVALTWLDVIPRDIVGLIAEYVDESHIVQLPQNGRRDDRIKG